MSDLIEYELGHPGWTPSAEAELVLEVHTYDLPLIGLVKSHGCYHVFYCVAGAVLPVQLFAFAPVSDSVAHDLIEQQSPLSESRIETALADAATVRALLHHEDDGVLGAIDVPGARPSQIADCCLAAFRRLSENAAALLDEQRTAASA